MRRSVPRPTRSDLDSCSPGGRGIVRVLSVVEEENRRRARAEGPEAANEHTLNQDDGPVNYLSQTLHGRVPRRTKTTRPKSECWTTPTVGPRKNKITNFVGL